MSRKKEMLFLIGLATLSSATAQQAPLSNRPNVVVFFVDDLGYNNAGFRDNRFETPSIDRLASESMEFRNAYIATPTCSPSRATLLTGKHPRRLQMVRHIPEGAKFGFDENYRTSNEFHLLDTDPAQMPSRNWLPLSEVTYAEMLKEKGYKTAFVGKWHLGSEEYYPEKQGFDETFGVSSLGHPRSYFPPYFIKPDKDNPAEPNGKYLTDYLTDKAVDYLANYNDEKPFLLQVSYYAVHTPHQGKPDLVKRYQAKGFEGEYAQFGAMVTSVDQSVGRIMDVLKERGMDKNTLVVFLSDQGSFFSNAPLRGGKMGGTALYEGGAKVPMFVRWPEVVKPGSVCNEPVLSTDIFPTLMEIVGEESKNHPCIDGKSLLPLLKNKDARLKRDALFLFRSYENQYGAMLEKQWKLIANRDGKHELYNLQTDPYEQKDCADQNPKLVRKMFNQFEEWEKLF